MKNWSYSVLDDRDDPIDLKLVLASTSQRLVLVRRFENDDTVRSRIVASFDAADFDGDLGQRNVECFHLCTRVMGHDGAVRTARSLSAMFSALRENAPRDPAGTLAALQEGDLTHLLARASSGLRVAAAAAS